ncbi:MAG: DUF4445 domain-containing protein, partial [Desulfobacteraceae bacterium]|nr:DUF4445 domain-containing protein [Desulfobacteraceae bacterium]
MNGYDLFEITFEPLGQRGSAPTGQSLLETARQSSVGLISLCGGLGKCGRCRIQISKGKASTVTPVERNLLSREELDLEYRLACQTYPLSDLIVQVPLESLSASQRVQIEGIRMEVQPEPLVQTYEVRLSPPSLSDLRSDDTRLLEQLKQRHQVDCVCIANEVLPELSTKLRSLDWHISAAVRGSELISIKSWPSRQLGLAVDLGTTKVAGYLVDLETGRSLKANGVMNPQIAHGEDVITRIDLARRNGADARLMRKMAVEAINELIADLVSQVDASPEDISEAVVVGNTAMHHLFLGLPVDQLARAPHVPGVGHAVELKAREAGLSASPGGYVHLPPNIAGFVGSDHVAMIQGTGVFKAGGTALALDIGTNTEICLVHEGKMTCVSCASGPAFEGAHIACGMRAADGAIEHMRFVEQSLQYFTIGNQEPVGICGSGILDAIAQLYLAGIVDKGGRILKDHPNVRSRGRVREFVIVEAGECCRESDIILTQKDVREVQLAKAAIRTGIKMLLEKNGLSEYDIDQVIVAGAFGSYLDLESAMVIGMFPRLPLDRFRQVGNAAGTGAKMSLISRTKRAEAQRIAHLIRYIELAGEPNFKEIFLEATA